MTAREKSSAWSYHGEIALIASDVFTDEGIIKRLQSASERGDDRRRVTPKRPLSTRLGDAHAYVHIIRYNTYPALHIRGINVFTTCARLSHCRLRPSCKVFRVTEGNPITRSRVDVLLRRQRG